MASVNMNEINEIWRIGIHRAEQAEAEGVLRKFSGIKKEGVSSARAGETPEE